MREKLLRLLLKKCPAGDLADFKESTFTLSCVFIFYKRYELMENILFCLNSQNFDKKKFEVVLTEDRGGSKTGVSLAEKYPQMNIAYFAPKKDWGKMGFMRNYGLSKARGKIILFLDDDTVITDKNFLTALVRLFQADKNLDAVMPRGKASYGLINGKYQYHDPFFFTNRCMAYRKSCLLKLNGFDSNFTGQEDVELAIRFMAKNYSVLKSNDLVYYHPPMIYNNTDKGYAVGSSFAKSKYNRFIKFLLFINGARWLLFYFLPGAKNRYMSRFASGFFKGFLYSLFNIRKKIDYE